MLLKQEDKQGVRKFQLGKKILKLGVYYNLSNNYIKYNTKYNHYLIIHVANSEKCIRCLW